MYPSALLTVAVLAQALFGNFCLSEVYSADPPRPEFSIVELMSPVKPLSELMTPVFYAMSSVNCVGCAAVQNHIERIKDHKMNCPTGLCIAHSLGSLNWTIVTAAATHGIPDGSADSAPAGLIGHISFESEPDPPRQRIAMVVMRC